MLMSTTRLEAFSDAVIAIIITIMVLELPRPEGADLAALRPVYATALTYLLSFIYLGIYWNNHHHMMHLVSRVNGAVLWANMHLLFWLSLVPFATGWMGETHLAPVPTAAYGIILIMAAAAYSLLQAAVFRLEGPDSLLRKAVGGGLKEKLSLALYAASIGAAFVTPPVSVALFIAVALIWLVPDRRVEAVLEG
jgi:TMEM175 potassium channel family protein